MNKIRINIISFFVLSIFFINKGFAQTITAVPNEACAPTPQIQFTGVTGASNMFWNFGDGTFAAINNPTHSFSTPNNFVVTYTAMVSGSPVTQTLTIKAHGKPTPNFSVNISKGCVGTNISFTDMSTSPGGTLTPQWQWSFGDGGVSAIQNPNYVFTIPGTFNITLIYKDGFGCDSAFVKSGLIKISQKPTVVITNTPTSLSACAAPFTATFSGSNSTSNSTTGSTALTYSWNLNGASSTAINPPAVTFTTTGTFPVSLTCTDNNNCANTQTVIVTVQTPAVKALVPTKGCFNSPVSFRDSSASANTVWSFGDGSLDQTVFPIQNFQHTYGSQGIFTITATANLGSCTSVKTFTINIEKVVADFTATPPFFCTSPMVVSYSNTSTGASTYSWSFSNGAPTSTLTSPTHTFTQGSLNPFTIFQQVPLGATLLAISPGGCTNSITKTIDTLQRPTAFFYTDLIGGCNPLTVAFRDSSKSKPAITSYTWSYGDGASTISTTNTPVSHTYTTPGVYYATLTIQNGLGCRDTSFKWPIHVATPPHTNFTFSPTVVCPEEPVTITNLTPLADSVNHWHVTSDASYFSHCISDNNPSWNYSHTGNHPLTLSAYSFGCKHDTTLPTQVLVKGPIVSGRFYTRCDSVFKVKFNLLLQDADFAEIRYGDGDQDTVYTSGNHVVSHTYATTGDYTVILKGVNGTTGCQPSFDTLKVKVRQIKSVITSQSITCTGVSTPYSASNSQDVDGVCGVGYIWFPGNNQPPIITDNAATSFPMGAGTQTVSLVVKDVNGCRDTSKAVVIVSYVTVNASLSSTIGCVPSFSLTGTQSVTSNTTITNYSWNFGDGSAVVNTANASHTYTTATTPFTIYNITLTAININGCSDSKTFPVQMNAPPPPNVASTSNQMCAGKTVTLSTNTAGVNTYTWNYGDGSAIATTSNTFVVHTYTTGGNYTVNLHMADFAGCTANSNPYNIQVQNYPDAIISYTNTNNPAKQNACAGSTVLFSDNSVNPYSPQIRSWDLGTGAPTVSTTPVGTTYTSPGTYTVTLINYTPFGCSDTAKQTIKVYSAAADFSLDKPTICRGEAIKFTIKDSTNVLTWGWDFGDGTAYNTTAQSPISHNYLFHPPAGTTNVSLTYYTADSTCKFAAQHPITIRQVIADFDRNNEIALADTAHCLGTVDAFTNTSLNANNYNWNFGDGQTSSGTNTTHTYSSPGTYTVSLFISDNIFNCKDTLKKKMEIFPNPQLTLSGKDTCQNKLTQLNVSGGATYTWSPAAGLNNPNSANPIATLSTTTIFSVTTNNIHGCVGSNTLQVNIIEPPTPISWDTSIVIGQTTMLPGYAGAGFNYTWTPSDYLSCTACINPVASPTVEYIYSVQVSDNHGCFQRVNTYTVYIEPKSSVDVPTAFTPNGDGVNDLINVDGWGIKKLIYFKVYNRWGEFLYETSDLKSGWDGYYKGVPQNMETYIYQAEVETYTDADHVKKTGYFKLLR